MHFSVRLTDSAKEDLEFFRKNKRRFISNGIALFLTHDANVVTKRRKPLRPNRIAQWELPGVHPLCAFRLLRKMT
jgi:hypothetical protein